MHIPIFPLNGAVLFPKTNLPLNIFEDRYIAMVDYALPKNRLIGMIQSKNNGELFNIGCLGKIVGFNETNDWRYLIWEWKIIKSFFSFCIGKKKNLTQVTTSVSIKQHAS